VNTDPTLIAVPSPASLPPPLPASPTSSTSPTSSSAPSAPSSGLPGRPLSPGEVRTATFTRTPLGRRGFDEDEVVRYLHRLADEIGTRDDAIGRLMHENRKLRHALREWHRDMIGYEGVDLVAMAQQQVEEQIAQTDAYSRQREEEAARLYDEIVAEAYEEAERRFGAAISGDLDEQITRQRTLVVAVLQSLDALATQVEATRQTFNAEIDKLEILDQP
jgi:DivIVA domain-containing protein